MSQNNDAIRCLTACAVFPTVGVLTCVAGLAGGPWAASAVLCGSFLGLLFAVVISPEDE